jgi:hypothetical protein
MEGGGGQCAHQYVLSPVKTHHPDSELISICSYSLMLRGETANINYIASGLTCPELERTAYYT